MVKQLIILLLLLFCSTLSGQTYPPVAIAAQNPSGQFVNVGMDLTGNVYTDSSGSLIAASVLQGYTPPVAMTGQNPSGQQVYLKTDTYGNLLVNCQTGCSGGGGSVTTVSPLSGTSTISCPTCAVTGTGLSQFASTTSAQLAGVLSDETGTGSAVFATSPTLVTPNLGTPSAVVLTNATGLPWTGINFGNENVASSATPTFSTAYYSSRTVLTTSITSFTLAAGYDGQPKCLNFVQGAGNYTVTPPANVIGFIPNIGTINGKHNQQCFTYYVSDTAWEAQSPGVLNQ